MASIKGRKTNTEGIFAKNTETTIAKCESRMNMTAIFAKNVGGKKWNAMNGKCSVVTGKMSRNGVSANDVKLRTIIIYSRILRH